VPASLQRVVLLAHHGRVELSQAPDRTQGVTPDPRSRGDWRGRRTSVQPYSRTTAALPTDVVTARPTRSCVLTFILAANPAQTRLQEAK
jgi:hypothetical protein